MGLSQALYTSISGLHGHQLRMDTIGNNLSNSNTVGFKKGVHNFSDIFSKTINSGKAAGNGYGGEDPLQVGLGTSTGSVSPQFTQGSLQQTGSQKDMAIEGNGFFVVETGQGAEVQQSYTRDGSFYLGSDGTLRGGEAYRVLGYGATDGVVGSTLGYLNIPIGQTGAASETTKVSLTGNLNSGVELSTPNVVAASDTTWTRTNNRALNLGYVETSAGLYDSSAGTAAIDTTDLKDLQFLKDGNLRAPFSGIADGDKVTISFRKGGLRKNAEFTYGSGAAGDGVTLSDFSIFLTGGLGDDGAASTEQRLTGGAMGTIRVRERTTASDGYDAVEEQAGGYLRSYAAGVNGSVDYDGDSFSDATTRLSIASNLGFDNDIRDIEVSFNNVTYTDIFAPDMEHGSPGGGSTSTSFTVYDSSGNPRTVNMQMSLVGLETGISTWRWVADSEDDTNATWNFGTFNDSAAPTTSTNVGTGLIRFDDKGNVIDQSELSETGGIVIDQGADPQISIDIVEGATDQDLDFSVLKQVAAASDLNLKEQDGNPQGTLDDFQVAVDGTINGVYTNGVVEALGRVALAMIPDEEGMIHVGGNLFIESAASGTPVIDSPLVDGRGNIRGGFLEESNVDFSKEFVNLIGTQRGFQANARVVSTSDEMLRELNNMKR